MKNTLFLLFAIFFMGCFAYDPPAKQITFNNKSGFDVFVCVTYSDTLTIDHIKDIYNEQDLKKINKIIFDDNNILLNQKKALGLLYWKMGEKYDDKIRIYIIKDKIIQENDWDEIMQSQLYVKLTYTMIHLKKNNWKITLEKSPRPIGYTPAQPALPSFK